MKNTRKEARIRKLIMVVIGLLLVAPFLLDLLYGCGCLSFYPNHFSASDWFTFIGSYLPAVIFGIITYYNSVLVSRQQDELEILRSQHRYHLVKEAVLYRFGNTSSKEEYYKDTNNRFHSHLDYANENAMLAEFTITDLLKSAAIERVIFKSAIWLVNKCIISDTGALEQKTVKTVMIKGFAECSSTEKFEHNIKVYMMHRGNPERKEDLQQFFNNFSRNTDNYNRSYLDITLVLILQNKTNQHLRVHLELTPNENTTLAKAVNYYCVVEIEELNNGK